MERIAFTGAQGTGKTTMRVKLAEELTKRGFKVFGGFYGVTDSVAREAQSLGFKINQGTNFETQSYISTRYLLADLATKKYCEENEYDFVITDRCVLDPVPYIKLGAMSKDQMDYLCNMLFEHFKRFAPDSLIYCEPLDLIVEEKTVDGKIARSADKEYQTQVDDMLAKFYDKKKIQKYTCPMFLNKDTVEKRLETIMNGLMDGNE